MGAGSGVPGQRPTRRHRRQDTKSAILLCSGSPLYLLPEFLAFKLGVIVNRGRKEVRGAVAENECSEGLSYCCFAH